MKKFYEKLSDLLYITKSEIRLSATIFGIVLLGFFLSQVTTKYDVGERNFQNLLDSLKEASSLKLDTVNSNPVEIDSNEKVNSLSSYEKEIGNSLENPAKNLGKFQTYEKKELPSYLVDLNSSSKTRLMELPGIGEKTADLIIQYRKSDTFRRIEDIQNVKGIGPKKFEKMKPYITVKKKQ